ncbi:hypothetical protein AYI68_g2283, partial [Smittium mucronatum]
MPNAIAFDQIVAETSLEQVPQACSSPRIHTLNPNSFPSIQAASDSTALSHNPASTAISPLKNNVILPNESSIPDPPQTSKKRKNRPKNLIYNTKKRRLLASNTLGPSLPPNSTIGLPSISNTSLLHLPVDTLPDVGHVPLSQSSHGSVGNSYQIAPPIPVEAHPDSIDDPLAHLYNNASISSNLLSSPQPVEPHLNPKVPHPSFPSNGSLESNSAVPIENLSQNSITPPIDPHKIKKISLKFKEKSLFQTVPVQLQKNLTQRRTSIQQSVDFAVSLSMIPHPSPSPAPNPDFASNPSHNPYFSNQFFQPPISSNFVNTSFIPNVRPSGPNYTGSNIIPHIRPAIPSSYIEANQFSQNSAIRPSPVSTDPYHTTSNPLPIYHYNYHYPFPVPLQPQPSLPPTYTLNHPQPSSIHPMNSWSSNASVAPMSSQPQIISFGTPGTRKEPLVVPTTTITHLNPVSKNSRKRGTDGNAADPLVQRRYRKKDLLLNPNSIDSLVTLFKPLVPAQTLSNLENQDPQLFFSKMVELSDCIKNLSTTIAPHQGEGVLPTPPTTTAV